jgi:glycosyltransferase involved in cell wall biosynthesis
VVAHLTTVDSSLWALLLPQLRGILGAGGEAVGVSAPGPWVERLEHAGIRHVALGSSTRGMNLLADLRAARQLWRFLRRNRVDVLHTHNPKPGVYGRVLGRLAGVPIVVNTVHGLYATETDGLAKRALVYGLEAVASRFSDAELYQNPEDLELVRRHHIVPRERVALLGNGIDVAHFDPSRFPPERRRAIRRDLGIGEGEIVVGTVARLVVEKGYRELFTAVEQLPRDCTVLVAGPEDPEKEDALSAAEIQRAAARGVRFLGQCDHVDALLSVFDVFVLASHREGFPRAAMEAAAMGLPIVAMDIRGCRQVVTDGINGLLVPPRDAAALGRALLSLVHDARLRARMGIASRARALESFDERAVVERVLTTYIEVARRKGIALPLDVARALQQMDHVVEPA